MSWPERKVYVELAREAIEKSPEWSPAEAINREYETRLYDYYGRPVYWFSNRPGTQIVGSRGTPSNPSPDEGARHKGR